MLYADDFAEKKVKNFCRAKHSSYFSSKYISPHDFICTGRLYRSLLWFELHRPVVIVTVVSIMNDKHQITGTLVRGSKK